MIKKHKNTILALIGIILVLFGYWYFFLSKKDAQNSSDTLVATNSAQRATSSASMYDKEFVANLQTVRYIDLNTEVFGMIAYKALSFPEVPFEVDYNIPVGRRNPFLPIGADGVSGASAPVQPVSETATNTATSTASRVNQPARPTDR